MTQATNRYADIIEGEFRVVASEDPLRWRASPNRRRDVARLIIWNSALMLALVALPILVR